MKTLPRFLLGLLIASIISVSTMQVTAQDQSETVEVDLDGYSITIPLAWEITEENAGVLLEGDEVSLFVLAPDEVADLGEVEEATEAHVLLRTVYSNLYDFLPPRAEVEAFTLDGRDAARWRYTVDDQEGIFYTLRMSDDTFGVVNAFTPIGDFDDVEVLVEEIVSTFDVAAELPFNPEDFIPQSEPCTISTDDEDTVQLRVGPGTNRSVVAFLPADEDFEVTGRFTTEDGDVWYQLDHDEAAPDSAAAEIWVAADDVDEEGDCEDIEDASAPPVIPITNAQPTAAPGAVTETTENTATIIPLTGNWNVTLASTSTTSCTGTRTVTFDSNEIFPDGLTFTIYMSSVTGDGSRFVLNGDTYNLQSNGFYIGPSLFNLINLDNSQTYLRAQSRTVMAGSVVANFIDSGRGCSQTTEITMVHE